jgi:hypothetical protein
LLGLVVAPSALAQTLAQALANRDWPTALTLARAVAPTELESQIAPLVQARVVPAMWMMGQARYAQGDLQGSANWFYRGYLGAQMDLAICQDRKSAAIVAPLTQAFPDALREARQNVARRSLAIRDAVAYYKGSPPDPQPGWSCTWALAAHYTLARPRLTWGSDHWGQYRAQALNQFCRQVGLKPNDLVPGDDSTGSHLNSNDDLIPSLPVSPP